MQTLTEIYAAKVEVKKSTFIATLCPFSAFKTELKRLKIEHPKAAHFVHALRYRNALGQIIEDKSDDGEPKGTSALPCLNVLRGSELVDVGLIVVRYFGGIKLGTGGLVKAYTAAANAALKEANFHPVKERITLHARLQNLTQIEHFLQKNAPEYTKKFVENAVIIGVFCDAGERMRLENFCKAFNPQHLRLELGKF